MICYGGSKPQNIGFLNKNTAGHAYLFNSVPPKIKEKQIILPEVDFFRSYYLNRRCYDSLAALQKLSQHYYSNKAIKDAIERIIDFIIETILDHVFEIRGMEIGWSSFEKYHNLPQHQKEILDAHYENVETNGRNFYAFINDIANWICKKINNNGKDDSLRDKIVSIATENLRGIL
jgi:hypothetical protein